MAPKYDGMAEREALRLKALEREKARLKRLVAERALDRQVLKQIATTKW